MPEGCGGGGGGGGVILVLMLHDNQAGMSWGPR